MCVILKTEKKTCLSLWFAFCFLLIGLGNAQDNPKILRMGIAVDDPTFSPHIEWFKAGMAEFGYIEDKTIRYIFYGFLNDDTNIDNPEIQKVISDELDIVFTLGNYAALWGKKVVKRVGIPALFSNISSDPVHEGIVKDLSFPASNITGIRVPDIIPKALEWLTMVSPDIKKVYLPYNPEDDISVLALKGLNETAAKLGIELVFHKIQSVEETVAEIEALPDDMDAIFRIPSRTLDQRNSELGRAAVKRKLPMGAAHNLDESVLLTFRPDIVRTGRQAARLANQILRGVKPADLPIETLEVALIINLQIAEKIGIHVPDYLLLNANIIIR